MKRITKFTIVLLLLIVSNNMVAQTYQGRVLLGSSTSFGFSNTNHYYDGSKESETSSFKVSPNMGFFIKDNMAIGAMFTYGNETQKGDDDNESTTKVSMLSPFFRYYVGTGKLKPFLHGSVGFGSLKYERDTSYGDIEAESSLFGYSVAGGLAVFFNDHVSLDLNLAYEYQKSNPDDDDIKDSKTTGFGFNVGFNIVF